MKNNCDSVVITCEVWILKKSVWLQFEFVWNQKYECECHLQSALQA
jgi:hypothetical protein